MSCQSYVTHALKAFQPHAPWLTPHIPHPHCGIQQAAFGSSIGVPDPVNKLLVRERLRSKSMSSLSRYQTRKAQLGYKFSTATHLAALIGCCREPMSKKNEGLKISADNTSWCINRKIFSGASRRISCFRVCTCKEYEESA